MTHETKVYMHSWNYNSPEKEKHRLLGVQPKRHAPHAELRQSK